MRFTNPIADAFLVAAFLVALLMGMLWRVEASAQQMYNGAPVVRLISTQLASSTTSLNFAPLPTNYNRLFLACTALLASSSDGCIQLIVGESSGPTWETAAHYTNAFMGDAVSNALLPNSNAASATDVFNQCNGGAGINTNTLPYSFMAWIDGDVSSTTIYKNVIWQYFIPETSYGYIYLTGNSYWANDTNAITGLSVTTTGVVSGSKGNIKSGTCTLYGMF